MILNQKQEKNYGGEAKNNILEKVNLKKMKFTLNFFQGLLLINIKDNINYINYLS